MLRLLLALALRGVRRPSSGRALLVMAWRFRRRAWWRRPPFLPLPSMTYLRWRLHTAYGDTDALPPADDVERFARWSVRS